jgi:hypothetical protein
VLKTTLFIGAVVLLAVLIAISGAHAYTEFADLPECEMPTGMEHHH